MKKCFGFVLFICVLLANVCCAGASYSNIGIRSVEFVGMECMPLVRSVVFYQTSKGELVSVSVGIPKQEGMGKAALRLLVDSPALREKLSYYDLYPVLPEGTRILGMTIKQGVARVDFSKDILDYSSERVEKNIFNSIVYTLTEFSSIDKVEIWIEGKNAGKLKYGFNAVDLLVR